MAVSGLDHHEWAPPPTSRWMKALSMVNVGELMVPVAWSWSVKVFTS